jgi:hypothetical protein
MRILFLRMGDFGTQTNEISLLLLCFEHTAEYEFREKQKH